MATEPRADENRTEGGRAATGADSDAGARKGFVRGVRDTYQAMPRGRRLLILGGAVAVLGALVWIVLSQSGGQEWQIVARGMNPEDLDAATKALEAKKIPYKLGGDDSLLVPAEKIHDARLDLAVSAMPSGKAVGFEVFDTSSMGRSTFTEKVNYHRALEGELARTIRHLDGVEQVRVHLVTPERRAFKEMDVAASASVVVSLRKGFELTPRQAQVIRQFVSGAVERLAPNQVVIIDQRGRMLAGPEAGEPGADGFEKRLAAEQQLEQRVVRMLEPVVGVGKVVARVALDYDFSQVVETRESFDPEKQVVRSEREQTERSDADTSVPSGPPGTASNLPNRTPGPTGGANGTSGKEKSDTIRNYEVGRTVVRTEQPLPRVQRMTVAVLVDQAPDPKGGLRARTPLELAQYTALVGRAVGLDKTRGDELEVASAPFTNADGFVEVPTPETVPTPEAPADDMMIWIVGGGVALAFLAIAAYALLRRRPKAAAPVPELAPPRDDELALLELEPPIVEPPPLDPDERRERIAALRARALELGAADMPRMARAFQSWFAEARREEDAKARASQEAA